MINFSRKWRGWLFVLSILFFCGMFIFSRGKSFYFEIPIHFSEANTPRLNIEIENQIFPVALDSGAANYLSLTPEAMGKIQGKILKGPVASVNFRGQQYDASLFEVDRVSIEKIQLSEVPVIEENPAFAEGAILTLPMSDCLKEDISTQSGRIGARLFESVDFWLLDLPHSKLVAIRDLEKYYKFFRTPLKNYVVLPLDYSQSHIMIVINTDLGAKRFAIDTGATISLLAPPPKYKGTTDLVLVSKEFSIGETPHNFGPTKIRMHDLSPSFPFEGILGRDFLTKHAIFLDFKNSKAYIEM